MNCIARNTAHLFCRRSNQQVHTRLAQRCKRDTDKDRIPSLKRRGRVLSTLPFDHMEEDEGVAVTTKVPTTRPGQSSVRVTVTKSKSTEQQSVVKSSPTILSDETAFVDSLLQHTSTLVDVNASNIIAFSGGVDSSLAAALVHRSFYSSTASAGSDKHGHGRGNVKAVLGVSASLPERQLRLARDVASIIGIELVETSTTEGADATYIENNGQACFICKNHLYSALDAVSKQARAMAMADDDGDGDGDGHKDQIQRNVIMYNGTNADDTTDPTRLGLVAAKNFSVRSPLIHITKDDVRRAAKHLNLPNWNYAASPCLRSRLALGVEATENHLHAVNKAEERVRNILGLDETMNLRVRMLAGQRAMVELGEELFDNDGSNINGGSKSRQVSVLQAKDTLLQQGFDEYCKELGFVGGIGVRPFKSGAVSR